jgi:hypothetical protein
MSELTYLQAATIGVLQGVTELFPVSSLGHSVLVPALIGGSWAHLVTESAQQSSEHSPRIWRSSSACMWPPPSRCLSSTGATGSTSSPACSALCGPDGFKPATNGLAG